MPLKILKPDGCNLNNVTVSLLLSILERQLVCKLGHFVKRQKLWRMQCPELVILIAKGVIKKQSQTDRCRRIKTRLRSKPRANKNHTEVIQHPTYRVQCHKRLVHGKPFCSRGPSKNRRNELTCFKYELFQPLMIFSTFIL